MANYRGLRLPGKVLAWLGNRMYPSVWRDRAGHWLHDQANRWMHP